MNILICTVGASWAVVPEAIAFVWPGWVDLYAAHPEASRIEEARQLRDGSRLARPDEIWLLTTGGEPTRKSLAEVAAWWGRIHAPVPIRAWTAAGTNDLASKSECERMTEMIHRCVLRASELTANGQLVLSLAGGRKTMSSDLQHAADVFGCTALLHVVGAEGPQRLPDQVDAFTQPLPWSSGEIGPSAQSLPLITPILLRARSRSPLLDIAEDGAAPVRAEVFPLPEAPLLTNADAVACFTPTDECDQTALQTAIERREQRPLEFLGTWLDRLRREETHETWNSLYQLPPAQIDRLRRAQLGPEHRKWLMALPRADLHCHLGGLLDLGGQREVARAAWEAASASEQTTARSSSAPFRDLAEHNRPWLDDWRMRFKGSDRHSRQRTLEAAALLLHVPPEQLERELFEPTTPRFALTSLHPDRFAAFERPGELMGSALLQTEAAVEEYARQAVRTVARQGLRYLELRCSPTKYLQGDGRRFMEVFGPALLRAVATEAGTPPTGLSRGGQPTSPLTIRLIWSLDRRESIETLATSVREAVEIAGTVSTGGATNSRLVVALDLAGDELSGNAMDFAAAFRPAFESCLPLTVHAGETAPAESIWQAAYALHADRIGHGLRLPDREDLATRLRNRGVCLELCPTSNLEVVGFRDPQQPLATAHSYPPYPLPRLLELGIAVALCTDNPGISRTTHAEEFLVAARLCPDGLTQWQALMLSRLAFAHAFLPAVQRAALLRDNDRVALALAGSTLTRPEGGF